MARHWWTSWRSGGAPFPRPAFKTGWVRIHQAERLTFEHNLGGDPDDYVIDMQFKDGQGVRQVRSFGYDDTPYWSDGITYWNGASWELLPEDATTKIYVYRRYNDDDAVYVRLRIWVIR